MRVDSMSTKAKRRSFLRIALAIALGLGALTASADETARQPVAATPTSAPAAHSGEAPRLLNVDGDGLALQGYDPVAYFVDAKATPGDPKLQSNWEGGVYRFASVDHKRLFDAEPARYVPAFGGYCAYGASIGKLVTIDPTVFQIEEGRLLLQFDRAASDRFNADARANLDRADANWPGLVSKHGTPDGSPSAATRVRSLLGF